ncbi:M81 family metallopeptidase [Demequina sp. SYSU T00068]|uniref:M81 family metallopeptidase n=1 Tax=Demequina lignilytica TaxID=3051663 RepID=UPI00263512BA|nr:M81 family metallopeptidase [Demequina sp. SYSU T00068]MDN4490432.1 M81 family metallopeptidase [Demequina sp. SYSU T00068]
MRIAIAGFGHESTMFTTYETPYEYFHLHRGAELLAEYDLEAILGDWNEGIEWLPTLRAQGAAGGPVEPEAYDRIEAEILEGLAAAMPLDGVYLDMHGAAHVVGRDHAEERMLRKIRDLVGPDCILSMSMDPHGNLSEELASMVDLATCHRYSPHTDNQVSRERSIRNLVAVLRDGRRPVRAWVRVPLLLPGERTSTQVEPGATVYALAEEASHRPGVIDAGMWVGFAWADEDRNGAAVMVTGDDEDAVTATAAELAQAYWDARERFEIVAEHGTWDEALDKALAADTPRPLWIADAGDNITAGASGDLTFALTRTLEREDFLASGLSIVFEGICDPESVAAAVEVGVGGVLDRAIGATVDHRFSPAVAGPWTVLELVEGLMGEGVVGAVVDNGQVHVSLHVSRVKFTSLDDPSAWRRPYRVWHDVTGYDVVVVKNGYMFPGQKALAASTFMALTPGGTELDFSRLDFQKVWRPIFPLDHDFVPDLAPRILPGITA